MKRSKLITLIFATLFAIVSMICVGRAAWQIALSSNVIVNATDEPVCYIGNTYYTSLGKAIDVANSGDTIIVIPGDVNSVYELSGEHTLKSGVTLSMPFDGTTTSAVVTEETGSGNLASNGYPDTNPSKWRKSQVIFNENAKLTISNGATFIVGACYGGTSPEGGTSGNYTEVVLSEGATIENYGTLYSFGFIKEKVAHTSQIISYAGSEIEVTLSIYDWGGAGFALARQREGVFPFKQYDFINVQVTAIFYYGSSFTASWNVYGNVSGAYSGKVNLVSTSIDSLLIAKGTSEDYMVVYTRGNDNANYTTGTINGLLKHETHYIFNGKYEIGHLAVKIKFITSVDIDSKDFYLPIATNTTMEIAENGEITSSYDVKFMMGTGIIINKNAKLIANGNMSFYQSNEASSTNTDSSIYNGYLTTTPSQIINDGILYLNKGFGGYIKTNVKDAQIVLGTNYVNNVDTKESNSSIDSNDYGTILVGGVSKSNMWYIKNTTFIDKFNDLSIATKQKLEKDNNNTYLSSDINGKLAFGIDDYSSNLLSEITGASEINVGANNIAYAVSLLNKNIIADSIKWEIDDTSLATIRQISNYEAQIDSKSQTGTIILTAQLMKGTSPVGNAVSKNIEIKEAGKLIETISVAGIPSYFKSVGDYFTIETTISPLDAGNKNLGYSSSNQSVVKVDSAGLVTAIGEGTATINIFAQDGSGITAEIPISISGTRTSGLAVSNNEISYSRSGTSGTEVAGSITVTFNGNPGNMKVTMDKNELSLSTTTINSSPTTIKISSTKNNSSTITLTIETDNGINGLTISETVKVKITSKTSCIVEGTMVLMADGTQKKVEDIRIGDEVMAFDHETGKLTSSIIVTNTHQGSESESINVINLIFDNGQKTRISFEHGFFDVDLNKYVYINEGNYKEMIGSRFYSITNQPVTLVDAYITYEYVKAYSPNTYKHINIISDNLLSIGGDLRGLFNIFELNDDMTINIEKMNQDIDKYGLYTYEEWKEYLTEEQFDAFNVKYLKVSIGKGLTTKEEILRLIYSYL